MVGFLRLWLVVLLGISASWAQQDVSEELPVAPAPPEMIRDTLNRVLGDTGKFVLLEKKGTVLVIAPPERIEQARVALATMDAPAPQVALDFAFRKGVPANLAARVMRPPESVTDFPVPTQYSRPRILVDGSGSVTVVPATPTKFTRRNLGQTLEVTPHLNPDGSVTLDMNFESTELAGFINYGSAILNAGTIGVVPVSDGVPNPRFFQGFMNNGGVQMPVFDTMRVSTSVVVYPEVRDNTVHLDLMPRLNVTQSESAAEPVEVNLRQFRTSAVVPQDGPAVIHGFEGASPEFNRYFMGGDGETPGTPAIRIEAKVRPGEVEK